jgi:metal-sulfur cluster biosynthetic enzyme
VAFLRVTDPNLVTSVINLDQVIAITLKNLNAATGRKPIAGIWFTDGSHVEVTVPVTEPGCVNAKLLSDDVDEWFAHIEEITRK